MVNACQEASANLPKIDGIRAIRQRFFSSRLSRMAPAADSTFSFSARHWTSSLSPRQGFPSSRMAASCFKPWISPRVVARFPDSNKVPRVLSFRYASKCRDLGRRGVLSVRCSSFDGGAGNGFSGAYPDRENEQFVAWFRQAWPYIRGHRGSTFVVVISGEIMASPYLDTILQVSLS